jgi:hypothetical protein
MEILALKKNSPWQTIWTRPRDTMRSILDSDPEYLVFLLAILLGIADAIARASTKSLGDMFTVPAVIALSVIMGPIGGLMLLYGAGAFIKWTGKFLGGQGSYVQIRAAFAWSSVPLIWGLLLWIPGIAMFGDEVFTRETPRIDSNFGLLAAYTGWNMLHVVAFVWSFVIFLKCLAEAQQYSMWRALLNVLLSPLPFIVFVLLFTR